MGSYSYLGGCEAQAVTPRAGEPELEAKYYIPLFWLAAFDVEDWVDAGSADQPRVVLRAPAATALARLRRRRDAVLGLAGDRHAALYDAWVAFVAKSYKEALLLRPQGLLAMGAQRQEEARLRAALGALAALDRGRPGDVKALHFVNVHGVDTLGDDESAEQGALRDRAIFAGWGDGWPPPPSRDEVARLDPRRGVRSLHGATDAELVLRFEERLVEAAWDWWAGAVPPITGYALWARGDLDQAYALARRRSGDARATALAWYAWLDPAPSSERAHRAAEEALLAAGEEVTLYETRLEVLALAPLDEARLVELAGSAVRSKDARAVVDLRLGGALPDVEACAISRDDASVLWASVAMRLAADGDREEAQLALGRALEGEEVRSTGAARVCIAAIRALGAWERWPPMFSREFDALLDAAFVASGAGGKTALAALLARIGEPDRSIALAAAVVRGLDQPVPTLYDNAELDTLYQEGQITEVGRWALRFAAANAPGRGEPIDALVKESLAGAHGALDTFLDGLAAHWRGPQRDAGRMAKRQARVDQGLGEARAAGKPTEKLTRRLARHIRALAEEAGTDAATRALEALEQAWGPASGWAGSLWTVRLLACAAGRSLEAAELDDKHRSFDQAFVIEALARDGHLEEARRRLLPLLERPLMPLEVGPAGAALIELDPAAAGRLSAALERARGVIPATAEEAASWLKGAG